MERTCLKAVERPATISRHCESLRSYGFIRDRPVLIRKSAKMNDDQTDKKLVIYPSGGLGDFVKTWGFLRDNKNAIIVTDEDRGELLRQTLGHTVLRNDTWQSFFKGESCPPPFDSEVTTIVVYRHEYFSEKDELIRSGLRSLNPQPKIDLRSYCPDDCQGTNPELKKNASGRIVFHVGAGMLKFSKAKTDDYVKRDVFPHKAWELRRSLEFARLMRTRGYGVDLIAGPAQRDQWNSETLQTFADAKGSLNEGGLFELVDKISASKCFIGFDSGPTHLAAQLGVPTVGMYGPTGKHGVDKGFHDLIHAEPLGPSEHLCLIHPGESTQDSEKPRMQWLTPENAADQFQKFLVPIYCGGPNCG